MNLFYAHSEDIVLPVIKLTGQESKHAIKVLRYRIGDEIMITDGKGHVYTCKVSSIGKEDLSAEVISKSFEDRPFPYLTLVLGLIKKRDRLEFAIEKSVELGVDQIIIFRGDHSEKQKIRLDRVESATLSAMKQSLRLYLPDIKVAESLKSAIEMIKNPGTIVLADETKEDDINPKLAQDRYTVVIGPEGGFSKSEKKWLHHLQAIPYTLGDKRLRTETAAMIMIDRFKSKSI